MKFWIVQLNQNQWLGHTIQNSTECKSHLLHFADGLMVRRAFGEWRKRGGGTPWPLDWFHAAFLLKAKSLQSQDSRKSKKASHGNGSGGSHSVWLVDLVAWLDSWQNTPPTTASATFLKCSWATLKKSQRILTSLQSRTARKSPGVFLLQESSILDNWTTPWPDILRVKNCQKRTAIGKSNPLLRFAGAGAESMRCGPASWHRDMQPHFQSTVFLTSGRGKEECKEGNRELLVVCKIEHILVNLIWFCFGLYVPIMSYHNHSDSR